MFQIAIDGPAGSGKSTIAKLLATKLNFVYISTGKYYRTYAYIIKKFNLTIDEFINKSNSFEILINQNEVFVNQKNISELINNENIGNLASNIATNKEIRKIAVNAQKEFAKNNSVVMDGRDVGTVILPNAQLKIFLIADSKIRALRRIKEYNLDTSKLDLIKNEIENRDLRDLNREIDPLVQADDAICIDTSNLTIDEVINKIIELYQQRI
ncbi:(d)CMP kinase [Mycoplasmoides pirum]|uniref:(d)CMP kinase n=1 Tax=Mycoplasmoides pirum TaxID=2122 RepID=UPI000561EFF7|nr:(d)CMP kinase [Mycoplasmoides pirum]